MSALPTQQRRALRRVAQPEDPQPQQVCSQPRSQQIEKSPFDGGLDAVLGVLSIHGRQRESFYLAWAKVEVHFTFRVRAVPGYKLECLAAICAGT